MTRLAELVGRQLLDAREDAGVSRKRLADRNGQHPNTFREVELGDANPTLDRLEAIAAMYGVEVTITITARKDTHA